MPIALVEEIDDDVLAEARSWVGRPLRVEFGNTEASIDNIRWYALGLGDLNPLWSDTHYGERSVFAKNIAPPTFLYSVYYAPILPGFRERHLYAVYAGPKWTFHERLPADNARLRAEVMLTDVQLVTGKTGIRRLLSTGTARYYRSSPSGEERCVAELKNSFWRFVHAGERRGLRYDPREPKRWSDAELVALGEEILATEIRGNAIRYWGHVSVGDRVGPVLKGPYSPLDQVAYYVGERGKQSRAFDGWWLHRNDDSATTREDFIRDMRAPSGRTGHWYTDRAREAGMPGAYDDGNQRAGVIASAVTNWMGDHGFLSELSVRHRRPVILGDVVRISGTVTRRSDEERLVAPGGATARRVDLDLEARNHLGEVVSEGNAVVWLPARSDVLV